MFKIPSLYEIPMSFGEAVSTMIRFGRGDLVEGLEGIMCVWEEHNASFGKDNARFETDEDFFETYDHEVSAFNILFPSLK